MAIHRRRQTILDLVEETGEVTVSGLAVRFDVSENTIRNDLNALEAKKRLKRVRGGATALDGEQEFLNKVFAARFHTNQEAKEQMARWAADRVQDGDAIVLDASSTTFHLATLLTECKNLTVVTNGLETAMLLARTPSNKVILAANTVQPNGAALVGELHPDLLEHFHAARCFVTCTGISVEQGLTESDVEEATLKSAMIRLAREVIALVDHSKLNRVDTYRFASLDQIDHMVTDEASDVQLLQEIQEKCNCAFTVVSAAGAETFQPPRRAGGAKKYRIGFGNMTEKMIFAQQVRRSLEHAAKTRDDVELLIRDNNLDPQTALLNAEWFVEHDVDLVIEYQIDAKAGNTIMDRFNQANIPVIAVDIPMPGATFFGADNYRAGYIAGEALGHWINKNWQGELDILLKLESYRVGPLAGARLQGQQEGLETVIGAIDESKVISVDSPVIVVDTNPFIARLLDTIPRDARVAIAAINDDAALGALAAFEGAGRLEQVVAVGQNADHLGREALRRDDLPFIGTTQFAPELYGERLLELALKILNGQPVPPAVYNQHVFITRENIDAYYPEMTEVAATRR